MSFRSISRHSDIKRAPLSSVTNNITNNDQAVMNQTYNMHNYGESSGTSINTQKKRKNKADRPFLFEKISTDTFENDSKSWIIGDDDVDVGQEFQKYQVAVAKYIQTSELSVETNTHEVLALSHILLIKQGQESSMFKQFIPPATVNLIQNEVKKKFGINQLGLESSKKTTLDGIIFDLRQKSTTSKSAVKKITELLSDDIDNKSDMLLLGVRNLIESLPQCKFNTLLRESNLSCSYVHCVLNPMFTFPEKGTHLMWLNTQTVKESEKQPDFIGNDLSGSMFKGPAVVGEVKGEDRRFDKSPCLLDLIRIGMLSGESINENSYDGVIGIHVVGVQMTFYIVSLMAPGTYIMLEMCTISLPKDFTDIRSYIANMEDLLPVVSYYEKCTVTSNKEVITNNARRMIDPSVFQIIADTGKDRKYPCSIVFDY